MFKNKLLESSLLRYLLVGGLAYLIEMLVLYTLHNAIGWRPEAAVAVSFWVGFVAAFGLQKKIAFKNYDTTRQVILRQLGGYSVLVAWNYVFTLLVVHFLAGKLPVIITRSLVIIIVTLWNYAIYKHLFRTPNPTPNKNLEANLQIKSKGFVAKPLIVRIYAGLATLILLASTLWWSVLGARVQQANADQTINAFLFESNAAFAHAQLPGAHTFLLKWPLFYIVKLFGLSKISFMVATVLVSFLSVAAIAYVLYRIERRPLLYGTLFLALASILLAIPAQVYPGGILPLNMAMLTTRNIEYILYLASLYALLRHPHFKRVSFVLGIAGLTLLAASDKLFLFLSIGGAIGSLTLYAFQAKWPQAKLSAKWLIASFFAGVGATALLQSINAGQITQVVSGSPLGPYGATQGGAVALVFAILGIVTNFGANPAYYTLILREMPGSVARELMGVGGLSYLINGFLMITGMVLAVKLVWRVIFQSRGKNTSESLADKLALLLLWSAVAATGLFIFSKHYYPVDARYFTIWLFAILIATASQLRRLASPSPKRIAIIGGVLFAAIVSGALGAQKTHLKQLAALQTLEIRTTSIAQALRSHKADTLVGDYWRVVPVKLEKPGQAVMPLGDCTNPRKVLTSDAWQTSLDTRSFAYLLSLDEDLTGFPTCSLDDVIKAFGRPNASVVIDGHINNPKELLLFYDQGTSGSPEKTKTKLPATVTPIPLEDLPIMPCGGLTIMQIVAHEDDDLLFMNPDLSRDIKSGRCIRTVYITAGDAGLEKFYWLGRQQGAEAAYAMMLGQEDVVWIHRIIQLPNNSYVVIAKPRGNNKISIIFLNLPDGNPKGSGFARSRYDSLARLESGQLPQITSVDGESSYTTQSLVEALVLLMQAYQPAEIRTQANYSTSLTQDHSDHIASGKFAARAREAYNSRQFENRFQVPLIYYLGYPVRELPQNVFGSELDLKMKAFFSYGQFDGGVCRTVESCSKDSVYKTYLDRQYRR